MEENPKCVGIGKKGKSIPLPVPGRWKEGHTVCSQPLHQTLLSACCCPFLPELAQALCPPCILCAPVCCCHTLSASSRAECNNLNEAGRMLPLVTLLWLRDRVPTWLFFPALNPWDGDESSCPQETTCNRYFARGKKTYPLLCATPVHQEASCCRCNSIQMHLNCNEMANLC